MIVCVARLLTRPGYCLNLGCVCVKAEPFASLLISINRIPTLANIGKERRIDSERETVGEREAGGQTSVSHTDMTICH